MSTNRVLFPDHMIDPRKKGREWCLQFCRAAWNDFQGAGSSTFYHARRKYRQIKDYAFGEQTIAKYKPIMGIDERANDSWMNIDWSVLPLYPKFRDMAFARLNKFDYNVVATPIDSLAQDEMENYFREQQAKLKLRKKMQEMAPEMIDMTPLAKQPGEPEDEEELAIQRNYSRKHNLAIEMEQAIELVMFQNEFNETRRKVKEDIYDYGVGGYKEFIDSNGAVKVRRVHPGNLVISTCQRRDFRDVRYVGEVVRMSIADLKQLAGDQFDEQEYKDMEKNIIKRWGNPRALPSTYDYPYNWDENTVHVLDLEWFSVDDIAFEKRIDKRGNAIVGRTAPDNKRNGDGDYVRKSAKVVYRAKWIIETDYMFDFGLATDMKRQKSRMMDTTLSYHLYSPNFDAMQITSKGAQVIPIIDAIQIAWYKLQQAVGEARPPGLYIDPTALEEIAYGGGGEDLTPEQVLDLYYQKGILLGRSRNMDGDYIAQKPVEPLDSNAVQQIAEWHNVIMAHVQTLRDITGLNELTDGSTPDPRTLTRIAELANESTNNSLWPIIQADSWLMRSLCESLILRIQTAVRKKPMRGYIKAIGSNSVKAIRVSDNVSVHEFGIELEQKPTDVDRERLIQVAEKFSAEGRLEFEDVVVIKNTENLKIAEQIIAYRLRKRKKEQQQEALQLQQANAQVQSQSAQSAEQAKQATEQLKGEMEAQLEQLKHQNIMQQKEFDREFEMMRLEYESNVKLKIAELQAQAGITKTQIETESEEYIAEEKGDTDLLKERIKANTKSESKTDKND